MDVRLWPSSGGTITLRGLRAITDGSGHRIIDDILHKLRWERVDAGMKLDCQYITKPDKLHGEERYTSRRECSYKVRKSDYCIE